MQTSTNEVWLRRLARSRNNSVRRVNKDGGIINVVQHKDGTLSSNADGELDEHMLAEYQD